MVSDVFGHIIVKGMAPSDGEVCVLTVEHQEEPQTSNFTTTCRTCDLQNSSRTSDPS